MACVAPYLKTPAPLQRVPGGFVSHRAASGGEPQLPREGQVFQSHGAWFQAHQPHEASGNELKAIGNSWMSDGN